MKFEFDERTVKQNLAILRWRFSQLQYRSCYSTEVKPYTVIDICENLDDETLGIIEKRLLGKHPNTYTLTKGLAEQIVFSKGHGLPIAIVRPSIVCAAYQEPFPGWIDNICGITGTIVVTKLEST